MQHEPDTQNNISADRCPCRVGRVTYLDCKHIKTFSVESKQTGSSADRNTLCLKIKSIDSCKFKYAAHADEILC